MGCMQQQPQQQEAASPNDVKFFPGYRTDDTDIDEVKSTPRLNSTTQPLTTSDIKLNQSNSTTNLTNRPRTSIPKMSSLSSYRVIVYKPQIHTPKHHKQQKSKSIRKHKAQITRDDLSLYFDTKRDTVNKSIEYFDTNATECVTDIEDTETNMYEDMPCDDDNMTVIHHTNHNSLMTVVNYDSDDTLTYHAYGGHYTIDVLNENSSNDSHNIADGNSKSEEDDDDTSMELEDEGLQMQHRIMYKQSQKIDKSVILRKILMNSKNIQNKSDKSSWDSKASQDINFISKIVRNVCRDNCLEKLETLGVINYCFVENNEFERWKNGECTSVSEGSEKYIQNPQKYIKMANITLSNSKVLIRLSETEKELFKQMILYGMEMSAQIYKINLNSANMTNSFLGKILQVLENRHNGYGPELLFIENNPISDRGIEMLCKYIKQNGVRLKHIAVGHCFANISSSIAKLFCESLKCNETILKITFDLKNVKHRQSVDQSLKVNFDKYEQRRKQIQM